jgi:hypothetical protein
MLKRFRCCVNGSRWSQPALATNVPLLPAAHFDRNERYACFGDRALNWPSKSMLSQQLLLSQVVSRNLASNPEEEYVMDEIYILWRPFSMTERKEGDERSRS